MPRRRYDVRYDQPSRQYVVEVVTEAGEHRPLERYPDWEAADSIRSHANARLEQAGELLPARR